MTSKKVLGIGLLITLLIISGCAKTTDKELSLEDLNIGGKGLEISLLKNSPPDQVWIDTNFKVDLELKNKGLKRIDDGIVAVSACENVEFVEAKKRVMVKESISLKPKSRFNPEGDITYIDFEVDPKSEDLECLFHIEACYKYETYADPDVCIDADVYNLKTSKVCQVKDEIKLKKQAAPVVVDKIEESILVLDESLKVRFKIFIKNIGGGEIINLEEYDKMCRADEFEPNIINQVRIAAKLSNQDIKCSPDKLFLSDNERANYFMCTASEVEKPIDAYVAPLSITLSYGYVKTIYKIIEVKDFE